MQSSETIYVNPVVIGELIGGFKIGTQEKKNREMLNWFLDSPRVTIVQISEMTAEHYADEHGW